jgi:hypothetical protein
VDPPRLLSLFRVRLYPKGLLESWILTELRVSLIVAAEGPTGSPSSQRFQ